MLKQLSINFEYTPNEVNKGLKLTPLYNASISQHDSAKISAIKYQRYSPVSNCEFMFVGWDFFGLKIFLKD